MGVHFVQNLKKKVELGGGGFHPPIWGHVRWDADEYSKRFQEANEREAKPYKNRGGTGEGGPPK